MRYDPHRRWDSHPPSLREGRPLHWGNFPRGRCCRTCRGPGRTALLRAPRGTGEPPGLPALPCAPAPQHRPEPAPDPAPAAPVAPQPPGRTRLPFPSGDAESRRAAAPPPLSGGGSLSPAAAGGGGGGGVAPRRPLTLTSPAGARAGGSAALRCWRAARAAPHGRRDPGRGDPGRQHPRRARAGGGAGGYGGEPGQTIPCEGALPAAGRPGGAGSAGPPTQANLKCGNRVVACLAPGTNGRCSQLGKHNPGHIFPAKPSLSLSSFLEIPAAMEMLLSNTTETFRSLLLLTV
ncbi:uncharacterized protein [Taeniopygia guttata]|uniref:uncharacterized protein n=1 Tax=Taeniopygia guttata TaxID=59729 RepID=UPI003BB90343